MAERMIIKMGAVQPSHVAVAQTLHNPCSSTRPIDNVQSPFCLTAVGEPGALLDGQDRSGELAL